MYGSRDDSEFTPIGSSHFVDNVNTPQVWLISFLF